MKMNGMKKILVAYAEPQRHFLGVQEHSAQKRSAKVKLM